MFKPATMKWVRVLILDDDLETVTTRLQEAGLVQLSQSPTPGKMSRHQIKDLESQSASLSTRIERMVGLLEEAAEAKAEKAAFRARITEMLRSSPAPEPALIELRPTEKTLEWCRSETDPLAPRLDQLGESLRESNDARTRLEEDLHLIRNMLPIKVPFSSFRDSELTSSFFFYLPADRVDQLASACREYIDPVNVSVVSGTTRRLMMVLCLAEDRVTALTQIHRFEGELVDLPKYEGPPAEAEKEAIAALEALAAGIEDTMNEIYGMAAEHLGELRVVAEVLAVERQRIEGLKLLSRSDRTILLSGWVPEKDLGGLESVISSSTGGRYCLESGKPSDEEYAKVPVSFDNPWPFSSFEWITKMYGMPNYREVDPTPLLAPTFVVFFGTCLSDAGYGLVLALLSFLLLRKVWGKGMGTSLMVCGLSTILMGWLFGGFFGNIMFSGDWGYGPQISFFRAAWVDPLRGTGAVRILSLALLLGIIHLILGHITAIMVASRQGRLLKGLVTHMGWCLTLSFGSIFVLWYLGMTEASQMWQTLSTWGMVAGILMGVLGYIWERSGSARATGPAQFMYDILGHIADVISYSRLLALGIATAVNAFLIDLIIFKFAWPTFSGGILNTVISVLLAIVLTLGFVMLHMVNMGLNCLSGFVHTMRLHFAEYFGKFYESGGEEFMPFKSERSLTSLMPEGADK